MLWNILRCIQLSIHINLAENNIGSDISQNNTPVSQLNRPGHDRLVNQNANFRYSWYTSIIAVKYFQKIHSYFQILYHTIHSIFYLSIFCKLQATRDTNNYWLNWQTVLNQTTPTHAFLKSLISHISIKLVVTHKWYLYIESTYIM